MGRAKPVAACPAVCEYQTGRSAESRFLVHSGPIIPKQSFFDPKPKDRFNCLESPSRFPQGIAMDLTHWPIAAAAIVTGVYLVFMEILTG